MTGMGILSRPHRRKLDGGLELRLLSALELLEARREAGSLAQCGREQALCSNACLLARALERRGIPVYEDGAAVLNALTAGEIGRLSQQWAAFDLDNNPTPEDGEERWEPLKKAWSTRLMSAFSGACSTRLGRSPRRTGPNA